MGTFVIALIVLAVILWVSASLIRDRKRGRCSCGGGCGSCPGCANRHGGKL